MLLLERHTIMKTSSKIFSLVFGFIFFVFTSCKKDALPAADCYKATLIAIDCAYIFKVEGVNIGENWHGIKNCVTVEHNNLPSDAKKIGSTLYFTSYAPGGGPYCTYERSYDYPRIFIELLNYSKTKCP
jgi:hypothetical protein